MAFGYTYTLPPITGSHNDYPIILKKNDFPPEAKDGSANAIANGGGDLRAYTDRTKALRLSVEVTDFVSSASPATEVHIILPVAATGISFYIEADSVETTQPAFGDPFGRNSVWFNYEYVSHDGGKTDSTGNSIPTKIGFPVDFPGKFTNATDYGTHLDEWYYRITVGNSNIIVFQAWTFIDVISTDAAGQGTMGVVNTSSAGRASLVADNIPDDWGIWDTNNSWLRSGQPQEINDWHAITSVHNSNINKKIYYDGVLKATDSTVVNTPTGKTRLEIGGSAVLSNTENWDGKLCECRVLLDNVISSDFIATEHENQASVGAWGTVGPWIESVTGTLSEQLDDNILSGSGTVGESVIGTLSEQLDDNILSASGVVGESVTGTLSKQLDNNTLSASGTVGESVTGTLSEQLDNNTLASSGVVGSIDGSLNITLEDNTLFALGTVGLITVGDNDISLSSDFTIQDINLSSDFAIEDINLSSDFTIEDINLSSNI